MDLVRRTPAFAGGQFTLFLKDLNNTSHSISIKGIKRLQDYISTYKPEVYYFCNSLIIILNI